MSTFVSANFDCYRTTMVMFCWL